MSQIQLHYDGWLALPAAARQKLGLSTGDRLKVELTGGTIVLRPARQATAADRVTPEPASTAAPVVKRGPGRPRKAPADIAIPSSSKAHGRRKSVPAAEPQAR